MTTLEFSDIELQIVHDALVTAPLSWGVVNPVLVVIRRQIQDKNEADSDPKTEKTE